MVSLTDMSRIGEEFEWEDNPEFNVVIVDSIDDAVRRFNELSPHFIVSIVSEDESEREHVVAARGCAVRGRRFHAMGRRTVRVVAARTWFVELAERTFVWSGRGIERRLGVHRAIACASTRFTPSPLGRGEATTVT